MIKNQYNENGRNMVEMLGVLAVIGVLTIGGFAGYKYAMIRHQVNEITDTISKMVVVADSQITSTGDYDLSEFGDQPIAGYNWNTDWESDGIRYYISLNHLPFQVYEELQSSIASLPGYAGWVPARENTTSPLGIQMYAGCWNKETNQVIKNNYNDVPTTIIRFFPNLSRNICKEAEEKCQGQGKKLVPMSTAGYKCE